MGKINNCAKQMIKVMSDIITTQEKCSSVNGKILAITEQLDTYNRSHSPQPTPPLETRWQSLLNLFRTDAPSQAQGKKDIKDLTQMVNDMKSQINTLTLEANALNQKIAGLKAEIEKLERECGIVKQAK